MNDSTKLTWQQVYQDFKGALSGAADALKTGSEHVYEVLVRQQVVNSISWVLVYVALIFISYKTWMVVSKYITDKHEQEKELSRYDRGDWAAMYAIPSVVTLVSLITILTTIVSTVTGFLNPEYGAIQEVREFIR